MFIVLSADIESEKEHHIFISDSKDCECVCTIEVPALKSFKFVERRLQREMIRVVLENANLSASMFSGTISKLQLSVS